MWYKQRDRSYKEISIFTRKLVITVVAAFSLLAPVMLPTAALAATASSTLSPIQAGLCAGVSLDANNVDSCDPNDPQAIEKINSIIHVIINLLSLLVGIVSVVMIIIGGFKYVISSGDSGNVTGAKNTIVFALVGLVIVALAQFIVRFVLAKVTST